MIEGRLFLVLLGLSGLAVGHLAFELGVRHSTALRLLPTLEKTFAKLAFGFVLTTWIGIVLAEAGHFRPKILLAALTALAIVLLGLLWWRDRPVVADWHLDIDYSLAVILLIAGIGSYLYFPAFESYFVARDQGTYVLAGVRLARDGDLRYRDPAIQEMDRLEQRYFFPSFGRSDHDSSRYMGFYLEERSEGEVIPQAMPGFPVWVAVGYLAGGLDGAEGASAWLAVLAAVALYYLGSRMIGHGAGAVAALLLATNFTQAWFARDGTAESAAQALILIGAYALVASRRHQEPFFGLLASLSLGLVALVKAELVLLFGALAVLLITDLLRGRDSRVLWLTLWVPLGILGVHTIVHFVFWIWPYVVDLLRIIGFGQERAAATIVAAVVAILLTAAGSRRMPDRWREAIEAFFTGMGNGGRAFRRLLSALLVVGAAYGYWLRPAVEVGWNRLNVVELGWAISPVGLVVATAGAVRFFNDRTAPRELGAVTGILVALSCWILWDRDIIPRLMWAYRRYVPILLPTACLLIGYLFRDVWNHAPAAIVDRVQATRLGSSLGIDRFRGSSRWLRIAIGGLVIAIAVPLITYQVEMNARYGSHRQMGGSGEFLRSLDAALAPNSLVVFEPRTKAGGLTRFEGAIDFLLDRRVVRLPEPRIDPSLLLRLVRRNVQQGRTAYLLTTGIPEYFPYPRAEFVRSFEFQTRILEETKDRLPVAVDRLEFRADLYRLIPGERNLLPDGDGFIDVGRPVGIYLGINDWHGWHYPERTGDGRWFRWTTGQARLWLPGLSPFDGPLRLRIGSSVPRDRPAQELTLTLDGREMGTIELTDGWNIYEVALPEGWRPPPVGVPELVMETSAWSPAALGLSDDPRELGVKVDAIAWGDWEPETIP